MHSVQVGLGKLHLRRGVSSQCNEFHGSIRTTSFQGVKKVETGTSSRPVKASSTEKTSDVSYALSSTVWIQKVVELQPYSRGCHVITRKLVQQLPELADLEVGMVNLFVQHTSASLTINENASPDVPLDLNDALNRIAPEGPMYRHDDEGSDDMPAHVKSSLMGASLTIPIQHGRLALGTWQGIYLNEHRNFGGSRRLIITVQGQKRADGRKYSSFSH